MASQPMTWLILGDLKAWIAECGLPDDTPVIIERDSEGNSYSPLASMHPGWWEPENATGLGHVYGDDDAVTAEQVATDDTVRRAVEDGDLHELSEGDVRCVVLGPLV